jgi:acetaldehyde dehydrogenase
MKSTEKTGVAIVGSGNIGTDLMIKILRTSKNLEVLAMVGIDPESDGLARARRLGIATTHEGVEGLMRLGCFEGVKIVFDATSAGSHVRHNEILKNHGIRMVDLTPAAIGPYVVPVVNLDAHLDAQNVNMVTCGGQATIPMVYAVSKITPVLYAEIVASIASKSAGPGTRANIDEFTETTSKAIVEVGGAKNGKAIIVLNPAEPPLVMRDTVYCLIDSRANEDAIRASISAVAGQVQAYVPGYRLKQDVQIDPYKAFIPGVGDFDGKRVSVFLEVEGAAHYLPAYAGNLDIMTSAALATASRMAEQLTVEA